MNLFQSVVCFVINGLIKIRSWNFSSKRIEILKKKSSLFVNIVVVQRHTTTKSFNDLYDILAIFSRICTKVFQSSIFFLCGMHIGFKAGCRPLIGLDGCFLKEYFVGQFLSDENNHIFVIAYACGCRKQREFELIFNIFA